MTLLSYVFQSTRPCGARQHLPAGTLNGSLFQSTRPCGARRPGVPLGRNSSPVSIHAPLRGATRPQGSKENSMNVSIHAPLRGATRVRRIIPMQRISFNPRAPAGRDPRKLSRRCSITCFNPRAPAGRDGDNHCQEDLCQSFNPRAPAGRDQVRIVVWPTREKFQSTRPCGARPVISRGRVRQSRVSIHAPLRGATAR